MRGRHKQNRKRENDHGRSQTRTRQQPILGMASHRREHGQAYPGLARRLCRGREAQEEEGVCSHVRRGSSVTWEAARNKGLGCKHQALRVLRARLRPDLFFSFSYGEGGEGQADGVRLRASLRSHGGQGVSHGRDGESRATAVSSHVRQAHVPALVARRGDGGYYSETRIQA